MNLDGQKRGFTLIELLIVVAIIAILAAIAMPNYLEMQTRSKVSRVKADFQTLATALDAYAVDNRGYLPCPILLSPRFRRLIPLTSPIPYLTTIPRDPFDARDPNGQGFFVSGLYSYGAGPMDSPDAPAPASRWILASDGPDRKATDRLEISYYPGYTAALFNGQKTGYSSFMIYDPTNGTVSPGDIYRANDAPR